MSLINKPFNRTKLEEDRAKDKGQTIGVWFNDQELQLIKDCGLFIHQEKPSTIIKQMFLLGANLVSDKKIVAFRELIYNNLRKNKRLGIIEVNPKVRKS